MQAATSAINDGNGSCTEMLGPPETTLRIHILDRQFSSKIKSFALDEFSEINLPPTHSRNPWNDPRSSTSGELGAFV